MLIRSSLILLISLLFISGCMGPIGGDYFFDKIQSLEKALSNEDWQRTKSQVEDMKKIYKKNEWKLQMLGDESEYEGIHESLTRLETAVKSKDSKQALLELATIKAYLEEIYTM